MSSQPNKKKGNWEATRRRIKAQNDEINHLKASIEHLTVTNKDLTKLLNKANGRVKSLEKDLNQAKSKQKELETENNMLKTEKKCLKKKVDEMAGPSQEKIEKLRDKIKELNADLRIMQDEYVKLDESRSMNKHRDHEYRRRDNRENRNGRSRLDHPRNKYKEKNNFNSYSRADNYNNFNRTDTRRKKRNHRSSGRSSHRDRDSRQEDSRRISHRDRD